MANNVCIFCGQKPGAFQSTTVFCGRTSQNACKSCEKELSGLSELEICRRALIRGLAENPERIEARMDLIMNAEEHRPRCLRCSEKLIFMKVQQFDNSPYRDNIFKESFEVQPAYCYACGKYEFYHPGILHKNKYLVYLAWKDTQD